MILLDTSVVIEILKGTPLGSRIQTLIEKEKVAITAITVNEVLTGEEKHREMITPFVQSCSILPFDESAAWKSAEIEQSLYKKGKPLAKLDLYIASISIANNLTLVSIDKDFKNVSQLQLIVPS